VAILTGDSGRAYTSLPIDARSGFPQSFPFQMGDGSSYRFMLYVDIDGAVLDTAAAPLTLPTTTAFLVVRVERLSADGASQIVFLRKVVPEQEYLAENIALVFPTQVLARENINGQGDFGSQVVGGIAPRWA
jgi:hypothetical protein